MKVATKQSPSQMLIQAIEKLEPKFDTEAFEVAVACVKAQEGNGVPVWMNIHAPPSSGKTVILDSFPTRPLPDARDPIVQDGILVLDSLTSRTLISGLDTKNKPGLLERVEACSMLIKDLAPLASNNEARLIFSQLRRVFDGEFSLPFGSGKAFTWNGRITILCASVSHLSSLDAELGARLLSISLKSIPFSQKLAEKKLTLKPVVLATLALMPTPKVTTEMYKLAQPYAEAVSLMRTFIGRDSKDYDVHDLPVQERAHRLQNQIAALIGSLCSLRDCKPPDTISTIERVCVESIQPFRRAVFQQLCKHPNGLTLSQIREGINHSLDWTISRDTIDRIMKDLYVIRLAQDSTKAITSGAPAMLVVHGSKWQTIHCLEQALAN